MKLILDNFYSDPDSLRKLALGLEFTSRARNFPGKRSTRTVIPDEAAKAFASILKVSLDAPSNRIPYNGCFQLMRSSDEKLAYVHVDASAQWAALVYLSRRTSPQGGTLFFQHKLTGLSRYPGEQELASVAKRNGLTSAELKLLLREDRHRPSRWVEIDRVGFVYNRFVLYDARLFHRNGKTWGSSLPTGRLTHNFFV